MKISLSEFVAAVGEDNLTVQNLDAAVSALQYVRGRGTKVTFAADVGFTADGRVKTALVVWVERDKAQAAIDAIKTQKDRAGSASP